MGTIKTLGDTAWRDHVTDGMPGSGAHHPPKVDIRAFVAEVDRRADAYYELTSGASYQLTADSRTVVVNKTSGSATELVLPVTPFDGQRLRIRDGKGDAGTNNITINGAAINGGTSYVINVDYGWVNLLRINGKWIIEG